MCGICGIYNYRSNRPIDEQLLHTMCNRMVHRGPDDKGFFLKGPIGLGMRRLSIIDVGGGHQPIHNEDYTLWIVYNGEIYNFKELRQELVGKGHTFYTKTDTEVIVHSYEEWGEDCVLHLNGIFGFSIWDEPNQRLFLARDHYGVKPLYYYVNNGRLLWGSEIKAILVDPSISKTVDIDALDLFLTLRFVPSPYTLFSGIYKLPPGHRLIVSDNDIKIERYWFNHPEIDKGLSEKDYVEMLQLKLEMAVKRQLVSDVPLGLLLSGGIDSGVLLAIMSKLTDKPVKTFTVGFKDEENVNEFDEARSTAKMFKAEHHEIKLDHLDYQQCLEKVIWYLEEPTGTTSILPMYFVSQLASQYVKVVLSGQGADEPHAGYHRYLGERYGDYYRKLPAGLRENFIRRLIENFPRQDRLKRAVRSLCIPDLTERFASVYSIFPRELRASLWNPEYRENIDLMKITEIINYWRKGIEDNEPLKQMTYIDSRLSLSDDLLMYGDKMSMASSIEARVPFLDLEYVSLVEAIPAAYCIHGFTRKYIHKKAVAKWLPSVIINRPKRGFETPIDKWFRTNLSNYSKSLLLSSDSACRKYFNKEVIDSLLLNHISGYQNNHRKLFILLSFELWHNQFINK